MINFFRKTRKKLADDNKPLKYARYAIGEIVLVVIGILIALQVNNWNETRREENRMSQYAKSLIQDLESDINMIYAINQQTKLISKRIDSLANYVQGKNLKDLSNTNLYILMEASLYRPFKWNRTTLDDLKNSGSLNYIKNDSLKVLLAAYDAESRHLDEDYNSDKIQSENASKLMSEIIDFNSPFFNEIVDAQLKAKNGLVDVNAFEMSNYSLSKSNDLQLLTKDMSIVKIAINNYLLIQKEMKIRGTKELPRLSNYAEEIIKLLREEYNQ